MLKLVPRGLNEKIVANLLGHLETKRRGTRPQRAADPFSPGLYLKPRLMGWPYIYGSPSPPSPVFFLVEVE